MSLIEKLKMANNNILLENGLPTERFGHVLYCDFRNMVRFETALFDHSLTQTEKVYIGLLQLFDKLPSGEDELAQMVDILLWFYCCGRQKQQGHSGEDCGANCKAAQANGAVKGDSKNSIVNSLKHSGSSVQRAYDFNTDAPCIYADFLSAYGVDLISLDYMHWWQFCALLENLPQTAHMAQKMYYRTLNTHAIKDKAQREHCEGIKRAVAIAQSGKVAKGKSQGEIESQNRQKIKNRYKQAHEALICKTQSGNIKTNTGGG